MERNIKFQPRNISNQSNKSKGSGNDTGNDQLEPGMYRKHKNHKWKECPDNPRNKKKNGEVSSTETPATTAKPQKENKSFVRFKKDEKETDSDDESVESNDRKSLGELWEISKTFKTDDEELHPVTVIGERLAASILVDQCCTGNGIISWDLAEALGFEMTEVPEPQKYKTTGGEFESRFEISVQDAILSCLSTNHTFNATFDMLPKE
jgi:hypothetical protein